MDNVLSKADRTRQFIIESTAWIFNTKGYAGTSVADLTDATKLTKGSIYGNFENKEEVALAAFEYNLILVKQAVDQQVKKSVTYQEKLMVYAVIYNKFMGESFPKGGCPILNTAIEADDTHLLLKAKAAAAIYRWRDDIVSLVKEGVKAGEFKAGMESSQLAYSIIALIEGGIMIAKVTDSPANLETILKTVEMLIVQLKA
ncbi:TetR/AcrR family transcriptional regulator [Pedobacter hartonius]|uniref:Transcriptional regulator, TetR family n=1 Tax=Pedobacter hartonius TaxID=425514 RepID=A0A1H4E3H1_9SPHI|nr:TetR/AcrR family transcriptional regulator [Pedobacter hartonius]SEA79561.1 transcriptional regulator, TetR family [Pedobacter hartonius]